MRVIDRNPIYLYLSIAAFYISSFSIAFMPAGFTEDGMRRDTLATALAVLFWTGILLGIVLTFVIRKKRLWDVKWNKEYKMSRKHPIPAYLHFFSNKPAAVFDCVFFAGVFALVFSAYRDIPESLLWIIIFITVFSLEMHFVFNGVNYRWLKGS